MKQRILLPGDASQDLVQSALDELSDEGGVIEFEGPGVIKLDRPLVFPTRPVDAEPISVLGAKFDYSALGEQPAFKMLG